MVLPLFLRRHDPQAVFVVVAVAVVVQESVGVRLAAASALLVAIYTIAAHGRRRHRALNATLIEAVAVVASIRLAPLANSVLGSFIFVNSLVAAAIFLGMAVHSRRQYLASLEDRARRAERERDHQAQLAATAERARIAREMHDVIAHSLSVVIRLADGAVVVGRTEPDTATEAMEQVASTSRQALAEMRRLLGVLREVQGPMDVPALEMAPQPGFDQLDTLLDDVRATGLPVRFTVRGAPRPLPTTAESTIFRLVQESITNVLKHAVRPTRVDVELSWQGDEIAITVRDDGITTRRTPTPGGHGLRGMLERIALYDGDLSWGPASPGGWELRATMRLHEVVA
ncbi:MULTISPECIES: sensor histidine kinase [unclassified Pseudofrankia]|uniref:sensor histidine kinase n=1 Tax=unclassified Pseudofrankia TaxID=2994372 RepID=UPI0010428398|nr:MULTISPECIES: histidine kinase [unclassified Pseudofrankia]MDT3439947.1 histidine kinase [Pseudofrankia sp. BMG5.37]